MKCIKIMESLTSIMGFPGGSEGKVSACNAGDLGSIPESGRIPGEGNGNPLQYSCLENPKDRGAWCPWGPKELDTAEQLHFHFHAGVEKYLSHFLTFAMSLKLL